MDQPILTEAERMAIDRGRWFSALSPTLRHDLLRQGRVQRLKHRQRLFERGQAAGAWYAVAAGALRVSGSTPSGRDLIFCFAGPGLWLADIAALDGSPRLYDAQAHGATTLLVLEAGFARQVLREHAEMYEALLRLHASRTRQLFALVEDLQALPLRVRLAKQLVHLLRQFGAPCAVDAGEQRIRLRISQDDLALLVGGSRQRLNHELSALAAEGVVRVEPRQVVVRDAAALHRVAGLRTQAARPPATRWPAAPARPFAAVPRPTVLAGSYA